MNNLYNKLEGKFKLIVLLIFLIVGVLSVSSLSIIIFYKYKENIHTTTGTKSLKTPIQISHKKTSPGASSTNNSVKSTNLNITQEKLTPAIHNIIKQYPNANIQVTFKDINNPNDLVNINGNQPILAASLIKLLILVESLEKKLKSPQEFSHELMISPTNKVMGTGLLHYIPEKEIINEKVNKNLLNYLMIVKSDNTATNTLIDLLGFNNINKRAQLLGLRNTKLFNKLMLKKNKYIKCSINNCNKTSPEDISHILKHIYTKSKDNSVYKEALFILSHQIDRKGIPSALSTNIDNVNIYNKTGTLTTNRYDAAIIEHGNNAYVLVITVSDYNPKEADEIIRRIAEVVLYNYVTSTKTKIEN